MFAVQDVHVVKSKLCHVLNSTPNAKPTDQTVNGGYQGIKRHIRSDEVMHLSKDEWQALIMK